MIINLSKLPSIFSENIKQLQKTAAQTKTLKILNSNGVHNCFRSAHARETSTEKLHLRVHITDHEKMEGNIDKLIHHSILNRLISTYIHNMTHILVYLFIYL